MNKTLTLFIQTFREHQVTTLSTALGLGLISFFYVATFNMFVSEADTLQSLVNNLPSEMKAVFGSMDTITTPAGWLGVELYEIFVPFVMGIIGLIFGAGTIGQEEASRTIELVLARPLSRSHVILTKTLSVLCNLAVIAGASFLGVFLGTLFFAFDISFDLVWWATVSSWLLGLVFMSFTLAIQNINGQIGVARAVGAAALLITYFFEVIAPLISDLEGLKYASPLYYYDGVDILLNDPSFVPMGVLLGLSLIFYLFAHFRFLGRDMR